MKQYETYLFDADGTLFDTADLICDCFHHVAAMHTERTLTREQILSGYGLPLKGQLEKLLGAGIQIEQVLDDYMEYQLQVMDSRILPFPGVRDTLEKLHDSGKKLGIVTSRRRYSMERILDFTGTSGYFSTVVTPEDTSRHKPDAEPTLLALARLEANREHTLFTGDAEFDILSGTRAGVDTAFVGWSHANPDNLPVRPTWTLDSIYDISP